MKIVIISQQCAPALGPRPHRTTELAKELARRGHEVIVYALLGDYDYSGLSQETGITFKNLGKSRFGIEDNVGYSNRNIFYRIIRRISGKYLEFPMIEMIPLVKKALEQEEEIDYLISIAHPHTIHWGVAKFMKKGKNKIKFWVADCGDPYMKNPFHFPPKYFERYEREWCELCDYISIPIEEAIDGYYPEYKDKIKIIPQGFDFNNMKLGDYTKNKIPTFAYSGVVYRNLRNPSKFLDYLTTLDEDFKFIVYTKSFSFFRSYEQILKDKIEIRDYVPRSELLYHLSKMDFLINFKNHSAVQQPSKLIDYGLTKRPIIEISPAFIEKKNFEQFISGEYSNRYVIPDFSQYNILNVADLFLNLVNKSQ